MEFPIYQGMQEARGMAEPKVDSEVGEELVKHEVITREELVKAKEREKRSGTPWYRQLLQTNKINFNVWEDVLRHEFHPKSLRDQHMSLGDALLATKAITDEQLNEALREQKRSGRLLGRILQERGFVTRQTIAMALSKQHGIEFSELESTPSSRTALEAVPESIARRNSMIPIRLEGDRLIVLISDPQIAAHLTDVGVILGKRIYPMLTTTDNIREDIARRYKTLKRGQAVRPQPVPEETAEADEDEYEEYEEDYDEDEAEEAEEPDEEEVEEMETEAVQEQEKSRFEEIKRVASGAPVIKLVQTIIDGAANSGATDVHLDPQEPEMRVRYRIDGVLHDVMSIPPEIEAAVISRIKIMSEMDITETRHPQDGHISMDVGEDEFDIRVATLPTFLGERVVLRLLDQSSVLAGIRDLGLEAEDEKVLARLIHQPYGMILVTGPTGSGKTTTLYAALNQKNVMTDSIVTLEDPVEYQLSGINQVQIDTDIGVTFAQTLRASLRQDIDVLLVGEIRDADTARIAIRAAMTGHLVFSTLHTNDAPEAISTLRNMGVPSFLIASALTSVVAQRLVRKICENCKTSYTPSPTLLKSVGLTATTKKLYKGEGCDNCYHTGARGRTGIFEIIEITEPLRKMIAAEEPIEKIMKAAKLKTMADRCRQKLKKGEITAEEFLRVIRT
jgi:type IV pilus assembly protein PilB